MGVHNRNAIWLPPPHSPHFCIDDDFAADPTLGNPFHNSLVPLWPNPFDCYETHGDSIMVLDDLGRYRFVIRNDGTIVATTHFIYILRRRPF